MRVVELVSVGDARRRPERRAILTCAGDMMGSNGRVKSRDGGVVVVEALCVKC